MIKFCCKDLAPMAFAFFIVTEGNKILKVLKLLTADEPHRADCWLLLVVRNSFVESPSE